MYKLVFYDIEKDKTRNRLAKKLEEMGLVRLQYSVFVGNGNSIYWSKVLEKIKPIASQLNEAKDSCCFLNIDEQQIRNMKVFGNKSLLNNYVINDPSFLIF